MVANLLWFYEENAMVWKFLRIFKMQNALFLNFHKIWVRKASNIASNGPNWPPEGPQKESPPPMGPKMSPNGPQIVDFTYVRKCCFSGQASGLGFSFSVPGLWPYTRPWFGAGRQINFVVVYKENNMVANLLWVS